MLRQFNSKGVMCVCLCVCVGGGGGAEGRD